MCSNTNRHKLTCIMIFVLDYTIYDEKYFSDNHYSYIVRAITGGHGYVSQLLWMHAQCRREKVLTASILQGSGLVRTVGQCAQKRVASGHGDTFSTEWCEAWCFSRGPLSPKPSLERSESWGLFFVIPISIIVGWIWRSSGARAFIIALT